MTAMLTAAEPFDLSRVCRAVSTVACPLCHRLPGIPCTTTDRGRGWHVSRCGRACKQGAITGPELIAVLWTVGVFTPATVIDDRPVAADLDGAA